VTGDLRALLDLFYDEAAEHLADLESVLQSLDPRTPDPHGLELMFRAARSTKASSITLGLADVTELAHQFERLFERLHQKQLEVTTEVRDAGLPASAVLKALLAAHRGTGMVERASAERARRRLQALGSRRGTGAAAPGPQASAARDAADAGVLPVGWRGQQGRRAAVSSNDAAGPTQRMLDTQARDRIGHCQDRQGRAGLAARKKP
jgi:two-component system, chemotaxis family, sensor kinase CheA